MCVETVNGRLRTAVTAVGVHHAATSGEQGGAQASGEPPEQPAGQPAAQLRRRLRPHSHHTAQGLGGVRAPAVGRVGVEPGAGDVQPDVWRLGIARGAEPHERRGRGGGGRRRSHQRCAAALQPAPPPPLPLPPPPPPLSPAPARPSLPPAAHAQALCVGERLAPLPLTLSPSRFVAWPPFASLPPVKSERFLTS